MQAVQESEVLRLRELDQYGILGTPPEHDYDHICQLTADLFEAPVALINLVAQDTIWVKSSIGLEDVREIPRADAFCNHTILNRGLLMVPDLEMDERFRNNPLVTQDNGFRFYVGAPLVTPNGYSIGTLCIIDRKPRPVLTERQRERFSTLAAMVMDRLEKRRLEQLEVMTTKLINTTADAIIIADSKYSIRYWNDAATRIFGFTRDEILGKPVACIIDEMTTELALRGTLASQEEQPAPVAFTTRSKVGREVAIEVSVTGWKSTVENDVNDAFSGFGMIVRDVTEKKAAAEKIAWLTQHDELTGVANRSHLRTKMRAALDSGREISVISINLDRFMAINDTFGHQVGDGLLKAVASRLRKEIDPGDLLARTGGDEFTIVRCGPVARQQLVLLALRIQSAFSDTFAVNGHLVTTSASIGIATSGNTEANTDAMLNSADLAIYRAKSEGGNGWRFFAPEHDRRISTIRSLETDLHGALARGEFQLHYQPQMDLATGKIVGAEALLRWTHPERGAVSPAEFIPVAELSGLIVPIGEWVLEKTCETLARLPEDFRLAVNLSPAQFRRSDIAATVSRYISHSGINPARLEVEITESLLLENNRATGGALAALKEHGVRIALDDFGTGYSSLAYLSRFPFDIIKIDRSFIQTLETNPGNHAIVRAIIGLGRDFHLRVIAEGIETDAQRSMLTELGCDEGQGYLIGRPMPLDRLLEAIACPA